MFKQIFTELANSTIEPKTQNAIQAGRYLALSSGIVGAVLFASLLSSATAIAVIAGLVFGALAHTLWTVSENYEKNQSHLGQIVSVISSDASLCQGTLIMAVDEAAKKLRLTNQVATVFNQVFKDLFNLLEIHFKENN